MSYIVNFFSLQLEGKSSYLSTLIHSFIVQSQQQANVYLLFATIIWGITPLVVEDLLNYLNPISILTIRFGIAVVILTTYMLLFHRQEGFSLLSSKTCIFIGLLNALAYPAATIGQKLTTAGLSTLLSSSFVVIVPFIAWKIEGKVLTIKIIGTALISLVGMFLISYNGDWTDHSNAINLGIIISLLAGIIWAFYIVLSSRFLDITKTEDDHISPLNFIYAINFYTLLPLFVISCFTSDLLGFIPGKTIPLLIFLGVLPQIVAFSLNSWAVARLGSINTSFFLILQVLVPLFFEFIVVQCYYTIWIYIGVFLVLLSMFLITKVNKASEQINRNELD